jgi:sortase A
VVIIGRRSSFGAPLRDLDRLAVGEVIRVRGGLGTFTYVVRDAVLAAANDATVFATRARRNTLTLMTAGSDWSAQQRFVVIAELRGRPQGFSPSTIAPRPAELGLVGDRRGWVPFVFALQLLLTVSVALVWLRRHWLAGCTWVVGVPTIGAACWMVFDQAARLLPSSL